MAFAPDPWVAHAVVARGFEVVGEAVIGTLGYRRAAERLRDELARLPGPEHAVELLSAAASTRS